MKSLDKALNASDDQPLRRTLDEACTILVRVLDLLGFMTKPAKEWPAKKRAKAKPEAELNAAEVLTHVNYNPGEKGEATAAAFDTDTATLRPGPEEAGQGRQGEVPGQGARNDVPRRREAGGGELGRRAKPAMGPRTG